jgi:8-oxo-dGTP pyrophosphatase MutT (NUDIX family)
MKTRNVARIVVINPRREILLLKYEDKRPLDPAKPNLLSYWGTPGGGVHEGESFEQSAVRELEEETGIEVPCVGPWVWTRQRRLQGKGELELYHEGYFVVWADPQHALRNRTVDEAIMDMRWWSADSMRASSEYFLPHGLADLVAPLLGGNLPTVPLPISE